MTEPRRGFAGTYGPALIGAALSILLARLFTFAPFFLVPLGVVAQMSGAVPVALAAVLTVVLNWVVGFILAPEARMTAVGVAVDTAYFGVLVGTFCWAIYGAYGLGRRGKFRRAYRISAAAVVSSLALIPVAYLARRDEGLVAFMREQAVAIADMYKSAAGADVVQRSIVERAMTPETITSLFTAVLTHGAVFAHAAFFAVSWRISLSIAALRRPYLRNVAPLVAFRNDFPLIWVLIASILTTLASFLLPSAYLSIPGWNLLLLCALLYGAQGLGVIAYNLARPGVPRLVRFVAFFLILITLFRPGINAFVLLVIAGIGVAENWLPLRAPKTPEPPPTPGA